MYIWSLMKLNKDFGGGWVESFCVDIKNISTTSVSHA